MGNAAGHRHGVQVPLGHWLTTCLRSGGTTGRFVPDAGLFWRELCEAFKDWLGVPAPHLRHDPCASLVMDGALHVPAACVALRIGESECLPQFSPGSVPSIGRNREVGMVLAISLAGTPAARSVVTMVRMACLLRSGSLSPTEPVITYWVQSRPSVPRTARSWVAFRWSWIVSSLASGKGITCCTSSSSRSPTRYGVSRTHRMSRPYKSVSHRTVVVISRSNPAHEHGLDRLSRACRHRAWPRRLPPAQPTPDISRNGRPGRRTSSWRSSPRSGALEVPVPIWRIKNQRGPAFSQRMRWSEAGPGSSQ